jgi:hypothetical protein
MNSLRQVANASYIRPSMTGPVGTLPAAPASAARSALNVAIFLAALEALRTFNMGNLHAVGAWICGDAPTDRFTSRIGGIK